MALSDQYKIQIANMKAQLAMIQAQKKEDKARRQMQMKNAPAAQKDMFRRQIDMSMASYDSRINQLKIQIANTRAMMVRAKANGQ